MITIALAANFCQRIAGASLAAKWSAERGVGGAETAATRVRSSKRPVTSGTRGNHSALTNL
jgi:hypothetical protein